MSRPILHATDFSPASRAAFAKAIELARRDRAPLVIAHVMTPPLPMLGDGYVSPATWDEIDRSYRQASQKKLNAVVARARAAGMSWEMPSWSPSGPRSTERMPSTASWVA